MKRWQTTCFGARSNVTIAVKIPYVIGKARIQSGHAAGDLKAGMESVTQAPILARIIPVKDNDK